MTTHIKKALEAALSAPGNGPPVVVNIAILREPGRVPIIFDFARDTTTKALI